VDAAVQFLVDRLKTQQGELADLGHPDYGSRHHELVGQPNVDRTRNLIKLYVLEALRREPRIEKVLDAKVYATSAPPRDTVQIDVTVQLIGAQSPVNFVVPFSLEVGG
jgi:phage baseplate assembly protein W